MADLLKPNVDADGFSDAVGVQSSGMVGEGLFYNVKQEDDKESLQFPCQLCDMSFDDLPLFNEHMSRMHQTSGDSDASCSTKIECWIVKNELDEQHEEIKGKETLHFQCGICELSFENSSLYCEHMSLKHRGSSCGSVGIDLESGVSREEFVSSGDIPVRMGRKRHRNRKIKIQQVGTIHRGIQKSDVADVSQTEPEDANEEKVKVEDKIVSDGKRVEVIPGTPTEIEGSEIHKQKAVTTTNEVDDASNSKIGVDDSSEAYLHVNDSSEEYLPTDELSDKHLRADDSSPKKFQCTQCTATFVHRQSLNRHKRLHENPHPYMCLVCEKAYKSGPVLKRHMLMQHDIGETPHQCKECGRRFAYSCELLNHTNLHLKKQAYECKECGKKYSHRPSLSQHMKTHFGSKSYTCSRCGAQFWKKNHLDAHMSSHTGVKDYLCNKCGATFRNSNALTIHMRTHTGEKPYACSLCSKTFGDSSTLKRHTKIHSTERPHRCTACNMTFTQKFSLERHMKIHTGEKPYACPICTWSFAQKVNLESHISSVHLSTVF